MKLPLFSVVIPAYNREKLIERTLSSVLDQTFKDYEIILVDDGSSDRTIEIVKSISENIEIIQKSNGGVGSARNAGIREAKGEYIAFLDSDDMWFPWTLETYAKAIELYKPARLFSYFIEAKNIEDLNNIKYSNPTYSFYKDYYSTQFLGFDAYPSACVARRSDLLNVQGFFEYRHHMEEADCWLRLGDKPGYVRIDGVPCCAHIWHEGNASNQAATFITGMFYLIRNEKSGNYPGGESRKWERRYKIASAIRTGSLWCIKIRDYKSAFGLFMQSLTWNIHFAKFTYIISFPALLILCKFGIYKIK